MLREYMRVIEQAMPSAPPHIGISGTPNTGSQKYNQPAPGSTAVVEPPQPRVAAQQAQTPNTNQTPPKWEPQGANLDGTNAPTSMGDWTEPGYSGPVTPQTPTSTRWNPNAPVSFAPAVAGPTVSHDPASNLDGSTPGSQPVPSTPPPAAQTGAKKPTTAKAPAKSTAKSNPMVKDLQQKLNAMGANLKVDGIMGPSTQAAMRKYQYVTPGSQQGQMLGSQTAGMNQPAATTPATQPTPRVSGADQARGAFATESVRYGEDPTLARIIGLAGL